VVESGRYAPLPFSPHCIPHSGTDAAREIENGTLYQLRLIPSGPVGREAMIAAGQKQSITLPAGTYKVVGRVNAPDVLPFYGEIYKSGEQCAVQFTCIENHGERFQWNQLGAECGMASC